ncbi:protein FAM221A [Octopus bimaculoides]|uniref:Protein FAM221A n=1 Tax=Octopus bimaculoides TaxID=37653 RepID=A0A0L8HMF7_OCTBM|nr:protein FAM221A [Octopus bimaculoides]|eukprot:XP_014771105.1 PREDICTED: protein FAM221A-like [Octopus bimaculoides]
MTEFPTRYLVMAEESIITEDHSAQSLISAYLEYRRVVGEDDYGKLLTPEEYEKYKQNVLPLRLKNRLFTCWVNPNNMDCKLVGPETMCFCQHRYKQHKTDFETIPTTRPILLPCRVNGCLCQSFHYVYSTGSNFLRCHCKHPVEEHSALHPFKCRKETCCKCFGFQNSTTCGCGYPINMHQTVIETQKEREERGHPTGQPTSYAAMGGITGFSSLLDGYMRLDDSGVGAPGEEFLSQPIITSDDPFLRSQLSSLKTLGSGLSAKEVEMLESSLRRPGEKDMEYFERRYQERLKEKNTALPNLALPSTSQDTSKKYKRTTSNK